MVSRSLLLVLLVLACLESFTSAQNENGPSQCCFNFNEHLIPVKLITGYKVTERRCAKPGVIFIMKSSRKVCADPDADWVQKHMKTIEENQYKNLS
ncbi:hypothetical protein C0J50_13752 [Silurus asotus]|uniref:C-C motif chemokine n=1 Tax=Silurus asotus TaxID=30991 RepID=A0AAD5B0I3_SILAS|nr:hypothetical protein C0J50_13752 [Silurus asotus]